MIRIRIALLASVLILLTIGVTSFPTGLVAQTRAQSPPFTMSGVQTLHSSGGVDVAKIAVDISKLQTAHPSSKIRSVPLRVPNQAAADMAKQAITTSTASSTTPTVTDSSGASSTAGAQLALTTLQGFSGLLDWTVSSVTPPDVQVAAGPDYVVMFVNDAGIIFTKTGGFAAAFYLYSFFGVSPSDHITDPKIMYDGLTGHFFATIADFTTGGVLLEVSDSSNPFFWVRWFGIGAPSGDVGDQPLIGLSGGQFSISFNVYAVSGPYLGVEIWILNKLKLIACNSILNPICTTGFVIATTSSSFFSIMPVHSVGDTFLPAAVLGFTDLEWYVSVFVGGGITSAFLFAVSGVPGYSAVGLPYLLFPSIFATVVPPDAVQKGTTTLLDTGFGRILDAAWWNNQIWLTFNDGCLFAGDSAFRSCIRLVELSTPGGATLQDFDFGKPHNYYFYAALRIVTMFKHAGDVDVVFGTSSSSVYPSIRYTGRLHTAPINTLQASMLLKAGTFYDNLISGVERYGDYSGAALDPTDTNAVWIADEYGAKYGATLGGWTTWIGLVELTTV